MQATWTVLDRVCIPPGGHYLKFTPFFPGPPLPCLCGVPGEKKFEMSETSKQGSLSSPPLNRLLSHNNRPQRQWRHLRERVTLSFRQTKSLGVVLALVVGLCHRRRAEGGVAQLTVVILCGQDHSAPRLAGAHLPAKTQKQLHLPLLQDPSEKQPQPRAQPQAVIRRK